MEYKYHYSPNLMVLGVFAGAGLMVYMATKTLITIDNITHLVILLSIAGTFFHYYKNGGGNKAFLQETIFFSVCNWGLLGTGILLSINFFTAQPMPLQVHEVVDFRSENNRMQYVFEEGNPYKGFDYIFDYQSLDAGAFVGQKLAFSFSKGVLGLKVFEGVFALPAMPSEIIEDEQRN